ncbi:MAG: hypothetical protein Q8L07_14660 [Sediminibacterium sp.]|nr:hypothetical protein [Sediminibacterium sp.]
MKQIPASELDRFKKIYFRDLVNRMLNQSLKKYLNPYWKDENFHEPKNKINYWLWEQYMSIIHITDMDIAEVFTNKLFDTFSGDEKFISFLFSYKTFYNGVTGLKGVAMLDFYEDYNEKSIAIYTASTFRFNQEEVLKSFCLWFKKEGLLDQVIISGETEKQKEICKIYTDHFFNRLPISSLPKPKLMAWNEWLTSVGNFFKGG